MVYIYFYSYLSFACLFFPNFLSHFFTHFCYTMKRLSFIFCKRGHCILTVSAECREYMHIERFIMTKYYTFAAYLFLTKVLYLNFYVNTSLYVVTFNIKILEGNIDMFVNHHSNNKYAFL